MPWEVHLVYFADCSGPALLKTLGGLTTDEILLQFADAVSQPA